MEEKINGGNFFDESFDAIDCAMEALFSRNTASIDNTKTFFLGGDYYLKRIEHFKYDSILKGGGRPLEYYTFVFVSSKDERTLDTLSVKRDGEWYSQANGNTQYLSFTNITGDARMAVSKNCTTVLVDFVKQAVAKEIDCIIESMKAASDKLKNGAN